jgi:RNA ligase (TIGR02306 family)
MSSFSVRVVSIRVLPHPGADLLELAQVDGYRAVVRKDQFQDGDLAVYIPEQAIVPDALLEEFGLVGRLAGADKNRVKAVRLRGELSQGLVVRPSVVSIDELAELARDEVDLADRLGIQKWIPPLPAHMAGEVEHGDFIAMFDVENQQRFPDVFSETDLVQATEKVHGTACVITVTRDSVHVTSKGLSRRSLALTESDGNIYWQAVVQHGLVELGRALLDQIGTDRIGLFGEVYGAGIQDLTYGVGRGERGFALFDISYLDGREMKFVDAAGMRDLVAGRVPCAPVLYTGPFDEAGLWELASGRETLSGGQTHLREGVVVRSLSERFSDQLGGRAMVKFVSADYLTRKGGTELE